MKIAARHPRQPRSVDLSCPTGVHGVSHGVATSIRDIHDARRSVITRRTVSRIRHFVSRLVTVPECHR